MFIAVPTGVKIFNWISTMWRGKLSFTTPMLFAIGFVTMFTIGGLSGVTHGVVPGDTQQTDTYYIVAHFHYVLFGGSMFGLFAGAYYWYPKFAGRLLDERLGKLHFWLMFIGFNMTFGPFHILGLQGMPRRIYTYPEGRGWDVWNLVSTIGSFVIAVSILVFIVNLVQNRKRQEVADDPWDARTLEWSIPSPPPEYNFKEIPLVTSRDELWHRKYTEDEHGRSVRRELPVGQPKMAGTEVEPAPAEGNEAPDHLDEGAAHGEGHGEDEPHIHMPSPSYWPLVTSLGLPIICYGMIYKAWVVAIIGGIWTVAGMYAWALEPATAPEDSPVHGPDTAGHDVEPVPAS
jgi:cytochrome c oxidase subunit 1